MDELEGFKQHNSELVNESNSLAADKNKVIEMADDQLPQEAQVTSEVSMDNTNILVLTVRGAEYQ